MASAFYQHIRFLLRSLDRSNSESVLSKLRKLADGYKESIEVLRACFDHIDVYAIAKNTPIDPVIVSVLKDLLAKPNFGSLFCESITSEAIKDGFPDNLSHAFCLSVSENIAVGLALFASENPDTRNIDGLLANGVTLGSKEEGRRILMILQQSEDLSKHVEAFLEMLNLVPQNETDLSSLAPLTSNESEDAVPKLDYLYDSANGFDSIVAAMDRDANIAGIIEELGYGCTVDANNCKKILFYLSPLTEPTISRIIGTVVCTDGGMLEGQNAFSLFHFATGCNLASDLPKPSSWNINVLVDSIKELAPETNWDLVMKNMDYEGFFLPDEGAFSCLMTVFKHACKDPFPVHYICRSVWNNAQGQLSFLKYAVSSQAEIFTLSQSARQLELPDSIKGRILESKLSNHAWFCLDLLDVLCQLAKRGFRASVLSILDYPLKQCPEVLLRGLACLKILNQFLKMMPFTQAFKLAVLAYDKNLLNLDKWLSDNLVSDMDASVEECLKYLNEILMKFVFLNDTQECLKYLNDQLETSGQEIDRLNIHFHTAVFLKALQANPHSIISKDLREQIDRLSSEKKEVDFHIKDLGPSHPSVEDKPAAVTLLPLEANVLLPHANPMKKEVDFHIKDLGTSHPSVEDKPAAVTLLPLEANVLLPHAHPMAFHEKVNFIFNNLTAAKIKCTKEFSEVLTEQAWYAQYIVDRARKELNQHELYLNVLEIANSKTLKEEVLKKTCEKCKVLLLSDLNKASPEERDQLCNLGSWLGRLAFGRIQVLKEHNMDPNALIIEAYGKGSMNAVLPFISKILKAFQISVPPTSSQWTMEILSLLAEIHVMPNLKMNLKLCIELLFRDLVIEIGEVTPSSLLKDRDRAFEGNFDFRIKALGPSHPSVEDKPAEATLLPSVDIPLEAKMSLAHPHPMPLISSITKDIVVNPKIASMELHGLFRRVLPIALDKAIKEIVPRIAQRSGSIAVQTTKELAIKEPLRVSLRNQLRTSVNEHLEEAILHATNDNLDLACSFIENPAAEKVIRQDLAMRVAYNSHPVEAAEPDNCRFHKQVSSLMLMWRGICELRTANDATLNYTSQLHQSEWPSLHLLLVDLFQFMEPILRNCVPQTVGFLPYEETIRVLLVLQQGFPEFLCAYHFSFCDVIPPICIKMRNIVLSATPNIEIVELDQPPLILSEVDAALKAELMKADVDQYLKTTKQQDSPFLIHLKQKLLLSESEADRKGTRYNVPLINSLVLYLGNQAIQQLPSWTSSQPQSASNPAPEGARWIFRTLKNELDTEGRYHFLNAIANQLRYQNSHTLYFSELMISLFRDAGQEIFRDQVIEVLLERLLVSPYPWGLKITFIQLIKNPTCEFQTFFSQCDPEYKKLLVSVHYEISRLV